MTYTIPVNIHKYFWRVYRIPSFSLLGGLLSLAGPTWYYTAIIMLVVYISAVVTNTLFWKGNAIEITEEGIKRGTQKIAYSDITEYGLIENPAYSSGVFRASLYKFEIKNIIEVKSKKIAMHLAPVGTDIIFAAIKAGKSNNKEELRKVLSRPGSAKVTVGMIMREYWEIPFAIVLGPISLWIARQIWFL